MDDYDRGYRKQFRSSEGGLEIVRGKVYSANHPVFAPRIAASPSPDPHRPPPPRRQETGKKGGKKWGLSDPEMKRRRRVAGYKAFGVEGRLKSSLRSGLRWVKAKCSKLVRGF